jgi:flavin reductase (DIM6/NTAB) family NADH-FMN oxidoreductase RutF
MRFDLNTLDPSIGYKLLAASVVPRPIAWITTRDRQGRVNAAPYSFFNVMGSRPPVVAVGIQADPEKGLKDSARNILETGEFVVNLVPESLLEAMNVTSVDAPTGIDELELAGLQTSASSHIKAPRIADAPVSFECVNLSSLSTGPSQTLVVGRVLAIHVADAFVKDAERGHIDTPAMGLIGRLHGAGYARLTDTFEYQRPTWAEWQARRNTSGP